MTSKRVLIIDDDEDLCEEIAEALRDNGYSARNTSNPIEGKEFVDKYPFDVVFVDYKMPNLNGFDFIKIIKDKDPKTKIFVMTGVATIANFLKEEKAHHLIDGIINKPFEEKDLLDRLSGSPS